MHIVFLRNHFHAGGVNMTTYTDGYRCIGNSTYDDNGSIVDISACGFKQKNDSAESLQLQRGQKLYVESVYKQDDLPHYGVMSMSFVYAHIPRTTSVLV